MCFMFYKILTSIKIVKIKNCYKFAILRDLYLILHLQNTMTSAFKMVKWFVMGKLCFNLFKN